jgi:hypothetical protein
VDDEDLGVTLEQGRRRRMQVELPEEPPERLLLIRGQTLVRKKMTPLSISAS